MIETLRQWFGGSPALQTEPIRVDSTAEPLPVVLSPGQAHPIDLRWVDELMASVRPHVMVRPEDELLILVPNTPIKINPTAIRVLGAIVDEGLGIADVLRREGDRPSRRRELHYFFTDLQDWLRGSLGEGLGRRGVTTEAFSAEFAEYPVISEIALSYRCNLSCEFCYAGCFASGLPPGWSEDRTMSDDQVCSVLDVIRHDAHCPSVSFTGGEPTIRPGLPRFVRHAKDLGMKVNIISNGQMLSERLVASLAEAGLDSAQLSLEGPTAEVHDSQVKRPGAFNRLWAGVERLREHGIRVHTNTTMSQRNVPYLEQLVDEIAERGMTRMTMNLVIPCGTGKEQSLLIPYTEVGEHILRVKNRADDHGIQFIWYSPIPMCIFNTVAHGLGNQGCAAADGLLHVNPAGDVLPCSSFEHQESIGNLLEQSFAEVWASQEAHFFRKKDMKPPMCQPCPNKEICQGACTLYWREVGLAELGGDVADRPPAPEAWGCGSGCSCGAPPGAPAAGTRPGVISSLPIV